MFPGERPKFSPAWDLLARWEMVQPVTHRPPLPKVLLDAMISLALTWGWIRWASLTFLAFHGAMRVGEPLKAKRSDLLLPIEPSLGKRPVFVIQGRLSLHNNFCLLAFGFAACVVVCICIVPVTCGRSLRICPHLCTRARAA